MKVLRLKLYQNLVNYRREMSYGYVQTYPLPTPSMIRGMAHGLLGINDGYKPLKISIQGNFDSVTTNMQKVFKFDRSPEARPENPYIINLKSSLRTAKHGVQFVDLIVNMKLLLHITFDDASLTEALDDAVRMKTVVLGRNEDIAGVDFTETGLVDIEEASDEITLNYNGYLSPDLCRQEQLSGTHYRLPFYYNDVQSIEDKRIFHFADAVYIAKGNKIENVSFMKDSKGDLVSLLEADH
ncbi:MAG TPA: CRISPR-associated protein Cas5 [Smithellaceae bacterium]|nr:CRISPR-associated protein Cas5 [Smithellaceae bacterium]